MRKSYQIQTGSQFEAEEEDETDWKNKKARTGGGL